MPLTGKQTRHLRALGHHLEPVVQIGKNGISEALVAQAAEAVGHHELIKVRLLPECPVDRHEAGEELATAIGAELVQTLGRTLLFWKRNPQATKVELPRASGAKKPKEKEPAQATAGDAPAPARGADKKPLTGKTGSKSPAEKPAEKKAARTTGARKPMSEPRPRATQGSSKGKLPPSRAGRTERAEIQDARPARRFGSTTTSRSTRSSAPSASRSYRGGSPPARGPRRGPPRSS